MQIKIIPRRYVCYIAWPKSWYTRLYVGLPGKGCGIDIHWLSDLSIHHNCDSKFICNWWYSFSIRTELSGRIPNSLARSMNYRDMSLDHLRVIPSRHRSPEIDQEEEGGCDRDRDQKKGTMRARSTAFWQTTHRDAFSGSTLSRTLSASMFANWPHKMWRCKIWLVLGRSYKMRSQNPKTKVEGDFHGLEPKDFWFRTECWF